MPLWYHPPAVPVNLGAPVFPGPLMYHPAPILVDPRPQYPCDTLYCACQFSIGPAPAHHWSSTAAPPQTTPVPEGASTVKKHVSWAGPPRLRREVETEWEYEIKRPTEPAMDVAVERNNAENSRRLNIRFSSGHLCTHSTPPIHPAAERTSKAVSLDAETVERIREEIRKDFERVHGRAEQAPSAQPEITKQHDSDQHPDQAKEISQKEKMEIIRNEIRKEMAAAYKEKMKSLEAREQDIQRRMDVIKMREHQWIKEYGEGIVKGKPAVSISRQLPSENETKIPMADLGDIDVNDENVILTATTDKELPKRPRPMRWLFQESELKSYYEPRSLDDGEDVMSGVESSIGGQDEPSASQPSLETCSSSLETTSESIKAYVAHLTGASTATGTFDKTSRTCNGGQLGKKEEEEEANPLQAAETINKPSHKREKSDIGASGQPWRWLKTDRNGSAAKIVGMGPTFNISSLISNPGMVNLKRFDAKIPELRAAVDMTQGGSLDPEYENELSSSSCSASYVSALRDLRLEGSHSSDKGFKSVVGVTSLKNPLKQMGSSRTAVTKSPYALVPDNALPSHEDRALPGHEVNSLSINKKVEKLSGESSVETAKSAHEGFRGPLGSREPSVGDISEVASLVDRDFSFCEPFYDWSTHDKTIGANGFILPKRAGLRGELFQTEPCLPAPSSVIHSEDKSDISSDLFTANRYRMSGAKLVRADISMTGELKWPPSPTVKTLSTESSSGSDWLEGRDDESTAVEWEEDLLISSNDIDNTFSLPTTNFVHIEPPHILDEPIVIDTTHPSRELDSPPLTARSSTSHRISENERVFKLPSSATGHELAITISRSASSTSGSWNGHRVSFGEDESVTESLRDHLEDVAAEAKEKRLKSVHWGICTEAERQFAASRGINYYTVDSDTSSDPIYNWSDEYEDGDERDDDFEEEEEEDGDSENGGEDEGKEDDEDESNDGDGSGCESQASTQGVVRAGN